VCVGRSGGASQRLGFMQAHALGSQLGSHLSHCLFASSRPLFTPPQHAHANAICSNEGILKPPFSLIIKTKEPV
jgi:hypothetical protein